MLYLYAQTPWFLLAILDIWYMTSPEKQSGKLSNDPMNVLDGDS